MSLKDKVQMKYIRFLRTAVGIVAAMAVFYGIVQILNYMYVNPYDAWFQRLVLHDFYANKGQIENLYLGSSHVYCDIDPMCLDDLNGRYNFNLSTPNQLPNGTFHLLREADCYNELSHVFVELYYCYYVHESTSSEEEAIYTQSARTWQNRDYMKLSVNKLVYMFSLARPEQYTDLCIPFSRYRTKLDDWDYIRQVIDGKQKEEYIDYKYCTETVEYMRKGYYSTDQTLDDCNKWFQQGYILDNNSIGEASENYLRKTIEYCQARELPLTLFVSPIYELQLISTGNYDYYID